MDLTYDTPIRYDFMPISGSEVTIKFRTKGTKNIVKINTDINIYYKDPNAMSRNCLVSSGAQHVHTSGEDSDHTIKMKVPSFSNYTESFVLIWIEPGANPYERIVVENLEITQGASLAVPRPRVVTNIELQQRASIMPKPEPSMINRPSVTPEPKIAVKEQPHIPMGNIHMQQVDKIVFISTWGIKCGIAQYTQGLMDELNNIIPGAFDINPIYNGMLQKNIVGKLTHLQHEFGIIPSPPCINGKVIITWHTIPPNIGDVIGHFESVLNVVAHIIPCEGAREYVRTSKDIYVVNLGSKSINDMNKQDARKAIGLNIDGPIGFVFGFQSPAKNYNRLINAAKNTNLHLIISGSVHSCGYISGVINEDKITVLNRHLSEEEIDLYALASDILLFDYVDQQHYSCSSAMHRVIGAGRPVICTDIKHFSDIGEIDRDNGGCALKFRNQSELEDKIRYALENEESLGRLCRQYAESTSLNNSAMQHIDIYRKYENI